MPDRLWCCHRCKLIGSGYQASQHLEATGHPVDELSDEMTAAVLAEQERQRTERIGDLIAYARFKQKVAASV